jgi:methylated-DNA-[protein]-cysteine S-methyltransferase
MTLRATVLSTPFGPLSLAADDDTVIAAGFGADIDHLRRHLDDADAHLHVEDNIGEISQLMQAYLDGDIPAIDRIPVRLKGSATMQRLWRRLRAVSAGTTVSYTELGGEPRMARVAASACARNPVCVIVPCHRVLRADGSLGGFGGGLSTKRWLLDHEARWLCRQPGSPSRPHQVLLSTA